MHFAANAKVWHPELGYVKYVRPLKFEKGFCYVETKRIGMRKVLTNDLFSEKPVKPKLTKEERFHKRFREQLSVILRSPAAYYVAGWIATHPSAFNISFPPVQQEMVTDALLQYKVEVEDKAVTQATDKSDNWSCGVRTVTFSVAVAERLFAETGVITAYFFDDREQVSLRQREFVLGFLGGELGFLLNHGARVRTNEELKVICKRVPEEFRIHFDDGMGLNESRVI